MSWLSFIIYLKLSAPIEPCTTEVFHYEEVERACYRSGRKGAKKYMKVVWSSKPSRPPTVYFPTKANSAMPSYRYWTAAPMKSLKWLKTLFWPQKARTQFIAGSNSRVAQSQVVPILRKWMENWKNLQTRASFTSIRRTPSKASKNA